MDDDTQDIQAAEFLEKMYLLEKRIVRLEKAMYSAEYGPFALTLSISEIPGVCTAEIPTTEMHSMHHSFITRHVCMLLSLPFIAKMQATCKAINENIRTDKAIWSVMVERHCGGERLVPSVPRYTPHVKDRVYISRLHIQPWKSVPEELYTHEAIEDFLEGLEPERTHPTVRILRIERLAVGDCKRPESEKSRKRLIMLIRIQRSTPCKITTALVKLAIPLSAAAQPNRTPDPVGKSEYVPWPKEYAYSELMRTTQTLIHRLRLNNALPHVIWEAFNRVDTNRDLCGLAYTPIHRNAFALHGINAGGHICPIFIFAADCSRVIARLPIADAFEDTILLAYGPFLFQTTNDGIKCYGPRADKSTREFGIHGRINWYKDDEPNETSYYATKSS